MITLTRLNGQKMTINSDIIKWIEASHDTVITLLTGEKIVVREDTEEVLRRIIAFRQAILPTNRLGASIPNPCVASDQSRLRSSNNSEDE